MRLPIQPINPASSYRILKNYSKFLKGEGFCYLCMNSQKVKAMTLNKHNPYKKVKVVEYNCLCSDEPNNFKDYLERLYSVDYKPHFWKFLARKFLEKSFGYDEVTMLKEMFNVKTNRLARAISEG